MTHGVTFPIALLATLLVAAAVTGHVGWIIAALIFLIIVAITEAAD